MSVHAIGCAGVQAISKKMLEQFPLTAPVAPAAVFSSAVFQFGSLSVRQFGSLQFGSLSVRQFGSLQFGSLSVRQSSLLTSTTFGVYM